MNDKVVRVVHDNKLLALIIRAEFRKDGIEFFTPDEFSQQLAYMNRPAGYKIQPHVHNEVLREVLLTQEVLFVKSGRLRLDLFNDNREHICSHELEAGDAVLLASGGHGIEMIEQSEILEVKQGPYVGENDKTRFNHP